MAVEAEIRNLINKKGHITIDEMMKIAMHVNTNSYYISKNPIGKDGKSDFITAPEISQMFGEMIGVWLIDIYQKIINKHKQAQKFNLIELGPGKGTMLADCLRFISKSQAHFCELVDKIILLEINDGFKKLQQQKLSDFVNRYNIEVIYIAKVDEILKITAEEKLPNIFLANEFFDVLPIKQFTKDHNAKWHEMILKVNPQYSQLQIDKIPLNDNFNKQFNAAYPNSSDGAFIEESNESIYTMQTICDILKKNYGAALIIDYGYDIPNNERTNKQFLPTLQAIKNHKYTPVVDNLGQSDLSAHVNFDALKQVASARNLKTIGVINQATFLNSLGLGIRLDFLIKKNPHLKTVLENQYKYLVEKMGDLFKVFQCIKLKT